MTRRQWVRRRKLWNKNKRWLRGRLGSVFARHRTVYLGDTEHCVISGFAGLPPVNAAARIIGVADVYVSDFGTPVPRDA